MRRVSSHGWSTRLTRGVDDDQDFLWQPASFVHASLRAPNVLYGLSATSGRIFGTAYDKNFALASARTSDIYSSPHSHDGNKTATSQGSPELHAVAAKSYFPIDAGSVPRGAVKHPLGGGCRAGFNDRICLDNICLVAADSECVCNTSAVPPEQFGFHLTSYLRGRKIPRAFLAQRTCWYPDDANAVSNVINASNSLWLTSNDGWYKRPPPGGAAYRTGKDTDYMGHTEIMATRNIRELSAADAIVVKLPHKNISSNKISLSDMTETELVAIQNWIQFQVKMEGCPFHNNHNILPIVFYAESRGMRDQYECSIAWGGDQCENGYRREFFSEQYNFSDGSCLASPPGCCCNDVYFYPPDNTTGSMCARYTLKLGPFDECETCRVDLSSKNAVNGATDIIIDLYESYEKKMIGIVALVVVFRQVFARAMNAMAT